MHPEVGEPEAFRSPPLGRHVDQTWGWVRSQAGGAISKTS